MTQNQIQRTARCACGSAKVVVAGDPYRVLGCYCNYCQRATGTSHRIAAWFKDDQVVSIEGKTNIFNDSERSKGIDFHFCPTCGTTLFWTFNHVSGYHAIAVGCFNDPGFPKPVYEMHLSKKIHWVPPVPDVEHFENWPPKGYLE